MSDLFAAAGLDKDAPRPLADRLRPTRLDEIAGQEHLLGPDGALTRLLRAGRDGTSLGSLIFWGPPGTGKTTVARLLAHETKLAFVQISAIFSGIADLKKVFEEARRRRAMGHGTLLFVDEIHRFNRAQLDSFLPVMEDGTITLIGATTENPSFELNAALLSRARVMVFNALDEAAIAKLLERAEAREAKNLPLKARAITGPCMNGCPPGLRIRGSLATVPSDSFIRAASAAFQDVYEWAGHSRNERLQMRGVKIASRAVSEFDLQQSSSDNIGRPLLKLVEGRRAELVLERLAICQRIAGHGA